MKDTLLVKWALANAIGLGAGVIGLLQTGQLLEYGFDFERHWQGIPPPHPAPLRFYLMVLVSYLVGGAILGSAQALVLRSRSIRTSAWILAASAGFGLTAVLLWPLIAIGLLGNIPGPAEPILATVGNGSLAGIVQYLMLRRRGIVASKWLLLWILGLIVSLVPTSLFFMSPLGDVVAQNQALAVFFMGFVTAGVGALISGKALLGAVPAAQT